MMLQGTTIHKKLNVTKTSARARVSTSREGSASINLHAQVPMSQATSSVTVQVSAGSAYAKVSAQEPNKRNPKRNTTTPAKFQEYFMLGSSSTVSGKKGTK